MSFFFQLSQYLFHLSILSVHSNGSTGDDSSLWRRTCRRSEEAVAVRFCPVWVGEDLGAYFGCHLEGLLRLVHLIPSGTDFGCYCRWVFAFFRLDSCSFYQITFCSYSFVLKCRCCIPLDESLIINLSLECPRIVGTKFSLSYLCTCSKFLIIFYKIYLFRFVLPSSFLICVCLTKHFVDLIISFVFLTNSLLPC